MSESAIAIIAFVIGESLLISLLVLSAISRAMEYKDRMDAESTRSTLIVHPVPNPKPAKKSDD